MSGSYQTYSSWMQSIGGYGFVNDVTTGMPTPSTMYDISTVSINESFSPLFGIDMTFLNNLTAKIEYRKTRVLTLSMTNLMINEARSNDFVIGLGYKIADFRFSAPKKAIRSKSAKSRNKKTDDEVPEKNKNAARGGKSSVVVLNDFQRAAVFLGLH